ncbi:MAG: phosphotransferase family protein [Aeromicrobium sp.]
MTALGQAEHTTQDDLLLHYRRFLEASQARAMRPRLLEAFGGTGSEPCHVVDAKYEPGRRAVVLYELGTRLLRGVVSMDDDAADGVRVVPGIRVSCFPHDPQIPMLAEAADADHLGRALYEAVEPGGIGFVRPRIQLLRYRPGRRATFRVTLGHADGARTVPARYVAKVYHDPGKAGAVAAEGRELAADHRSDPELELAPVIAHLPQLSVVVQGHLSGRELDCALLARVSTPTELVQSTVARAARALAALHTRSVPHGRIRSIDKELDRFVARSQRVKSIDPTTGEALLDLSYRINNLRSLVPVGPVALVHGDCKPSQFMLQQDRVALIDLDHCGLADPAYDVGNFLATMRQLAIREGLRRTGAVHMRTSAERLGSTFVEAYIAGTTDNRDAIHDLRCRVRWYEAVALERKALRAFARAPLSPLPVALVFEAHRKLDVDFQEAGCVQTAPSD